MLLRLVASLIVLALWSLPAFADDWVAVKLRGIAEALGESGWVALQRGDIVSDDRLVRTLADARLELQRGQEIITLGPNSQISIDDSAGEGQTIVRQDFGTVEVEAEVKVVEHFTVQTKFLAAVVKGTHFIVTADAAGASVEVTRGLVAVEATESKHKTSVAAGYTASIAKSGDLFVRGAGALPKIYDAKGIELPPVLALRGSKDFDAPRSSGTQVAAAGSLALALPQLSDMAAAPETQVAPASDGIGWLPSGIGVLIGVMIGSLALVFRRFLS